MASEGWNDDRMEHLLGNLLRGGVLVAAAFVLVGGTIYLIRHGREAPDLRTFHGEPASLRSPAGIAGELLELKGRAITQFGLLLLIATPVARVAFSAYGFARQRDRLYVALTVLVLAMLLYSLFAPSP